MTKIERGIASLLVMRRLIGIVLFLLATCILVKSAAGQSTALGDSVSACPIQIMEVHPYAPGLSAKSDLKVNNVSGKDIRGMKFQAAYLDATEDIHEYPIQWDWDFRLKNGKDKKVYYTNLWQNESRTGMAVWPIKILFEDGTVWQPEKPHTCAGEYWNDRTHKKLFQ